MITSVLGDGSDMMQLLVRGDGATVTCPITDPPAYSLKSYWGHIMTTCSVYGCTKLKKYANGLCGMHWTRNYRSGIQQSTVRTFGTGTIAANGYVNITVDRERSGEHVLVAEKALGKKLPKGAIVHHVDENKGNNRNENLVICPSGAYHSLLHQRSKALNESGNANWRKCWVCKNYDSPENLYINGQVGHKRCISEHAAAYYIRKNR